MSVYARQQLVDFQDVGYGSAAATCLFLIVAIVTVIVITVGRVNVSASGRAAMIARRILGRIAFYLLIAVIIFYAVFPFYWAIVSSLKTGSAHLPGRVLAAQSDASRTTSRSSPSSPSRATS